MMVFMSQTTSMSEYRAEAYLAVLEVTRLGLNQIHTHSELAKSARVRKLRHRCSQH